MQRARGPRWVALLLLGASVIAACDRDEGDPVTSDDVAAEDESAGSDDSNASSGSSGGDEDDGVLTCRELECPAGQVCVEPRPYCDEASDPPELRRDPAYCQPVVTDPERLDAVGELVLVSGIAMCDDPMVSEGPNGQVVLSCPDPDLPCL